MNVIVSLCKKSHQKISELSRRLHKSSHTISKILNGLEAGGYVTLEIAEDERGRPTYVSLRPKGKKFCKKGGKM